jgi:aspartate aminotransferase-like enzyme
MNDQAAYESLKGSSLARFVDLRNDEKVLFTPGPASLLVENLIGLQPGFGREDTAYLDLETRVLEQLREMTHHETIVRLQGSATLALEIACANFLVGRVLVVSTGFYSERLHELVRSARQLVGAVSAIETVPWQDLESAAGRFDWVVACSTETSMGIHVPLSRLRSLADRVGAQLMVDATGSIGLESGHELADAIAYSSCKGLFGLTGASFVAYNGSPAHEPPSFYLTIGTHLNRSVTGPLHTVCSLAQVLPRHADLREAVVTNKARFTEKFAKFLTVPKAHQPLLCTQVSVRLTSNDERAVLYAPRSPVTGSVVCHLGEVHLGRNANGKIIDSLVTVD